MSSPFCVTPQKDMFDIGGKEILIIAVLIVFLFGSRKIPELSRGIADAVRQLRGAFKDEAEKGEIGKDLSSKKK